MTRSSWIWSIVRKIPADPDQCAPLIAEILDALEMHRWSANDKFSIRMALEEAIMNAIKHGNDSDPDKLVGVNLGFNDDTFEATISDRGCGFDPEDVPDPTADENIGKTCGRGVMLMKNFVDSIEYNECGNEVKLTKNKSISPG